MYCRWFFRRQKLDVHFSALGGINFRGKKLITFSNFTSGEWYSLCCSENTALTDGEQPARGKESIIDHWLCELCTIVDQLKLVNC